MDPRPGKGEIFHPVLQKLGLYQVVFFVDQSTSNAPPLGGRIRWSETQNSSDRGSVYYHGSRIPVDRVPYTPVRPSSDSLQCIHNVTQVDQGRDKEGTGPDPLSVNQEKRVRGGQPYILGGFQDLRLRRFHRSSGCDKSQRKILII